MDDKISDDILVFDDIEDESQDLTDIPKEQRKLRTQAYDKAVSDLVRMMEDAEICLNPDYQREYIWTDQKASLLVESILLNVPIPVIYVAQEENDTWTVIDGLQRLNSLKRFFDGKFKLRGLEVIKELNGKYFKQLPPKSVSILRNGLIRVIVVLFESHEEIKYDIFMRLNSGAVQLNNQELRNCLYRGALNNMLKRLRTNETFMKLVGLKKPDKRFRDAELILRFFAFLDTWDFKDEKMREYAGLKPLLNSFMEKNKDADQQFLLDLEDRFQTTIEKVDKVFGDLAFRRLKAHGVIEKSVNRALMDCIMLSFTQYPENDLVDKKKGIIAQLRMLNLRDQDFIKSVTTSTTDKRGLEYRLKTWQETLDKQVHGEF